MRKTFNAPEYRAILGDKYFKVEELVNPQYARVFGEQSKLSKFYLLTECKRTSKGFIRTCGKNSTIICRNEPEVELRILERRRETRKLNERTLIETR